MLSTNHSRFIASVPVGSRLLACAAICASLAQVASASTSQATFDTAGGNGYYSNIDYQDGKNRLRFERSTNTVAAAGGRFLGLLWRTNFDASARFEPNATLGQVEMTRPDGKSIRFVNSSATFDTYGNLTSIAPGTFNAKNASIPDLLIVKTTTGSTGPLASLILRSSDYHRDEVYDAQGRLLRYVYNDGYTQELTRNASDQVISITDSHGRSLNFTYASTSRIATMTDPGGAVHTYTWDTSEEGHPEKLLQVSSPQGLRDYTYDTNTRMNIPMFSKVEVGLGPERIVERSFSTTATNGSISGSGGVSGAKSVARNALSTSSLDVTVNTNGVQTHHWFSKWGTAWRNDQRDIPAGVGSPASSSRLEITYDSGETWKKTDFNGHATCSMRDSYGRALFLVAGLPSTQYCNSTFTFRAYLPPGAFKVSTQYLEHLKLPKVVASPKRIQTTVYNGQPDPFNGNAILTCAPGAPSLPSGGALLLPCKVVTRVTTDANGSWGVSADVDPSVPAQVTTYQYNASGQVTSVSEPGLSPVTYAYYAAGEGGNKKGDLKSATDAEGLTDVINSYDAHGRPLQMTRADGLVTTFTYNNFGKPTTETIDSQTTTYEYNSLGEVTRVISPDGSFKVLEYAQDNPVSARMLTSVAHSNGNRMEMTHHESGVTTWIQWKKGDGTVTRLVSREVDALGRISSSRGE